jgi:hypothetical protein
MIDPFSNSGSGKTGSGLKDSGIMWYESVLLTQALPEISVSPTVLSEVS